MTPDAERRQAWDQYAAAAIAGMLAKYGPESCDSCAQLAADYADTMLALRDARFPAQGD